MITHNSKDDLPLVYVFIFLFTDAEKAFVSLSLFNILRFPMSMLPMMIASVIQSSVSIKRINKYMNLHELSEDRDVKKDDTTENAVTIEKASFSWTREEGRTVWWCGVSVTIPFISVA